MLTGDRLQDNVGRAEHRLDRARNARIEFESHFSGPQDLNEEALRRYAQLQTEEREAQQALAAAVSAATPTVPAWARTSPDNVHAQPREPSHDGAHHPPAGNGTDNGGNGNVNGNNPNWFQRMFGSFGVGCFVVAAIIGLLVLGSCSGTLMLIGAREVAPETREFVTNVGDEIIGEEVGGVEVGDDNDNRNWRRVLRRINALDHSLTARIQELEDRDYITQEDLEDLLAEATINREKIEGEIAEIKRELRAHERTEHRATPEPTPTYPPCPEDWNKMSEEERRAYTPCLTD